MIKDKELNLVVRHDEKIEGGMELIFTVEVGVGCDHGYVGDYGSMSCYDDEYAYEEEYDYALSFVDFLDMFDKDVEKLKETNPELYAKLWDEDGDIIEEWNDEQLVFEVVKAIHDNNESPKKLGNWFESRIRDYAQSDFDDR